MLRDGKAAKQNGDRGSTLALAVSGFLLILNKWGDGRDERRARDKSHKDDRKGKEKPPPLKMFYFHVCAVMFDSPGRGLI